MVIPSHLNSKFPGNRSVFSDNHGNHKSTTPGNSFGSVTKTLRVRDTPFCYGKAVAGEKEAQVFICIAKQFKLPTKNQHTKVP